MIPGQKRPPTDETLQELKKLLQDKGLRALLKAVELIYRVGDGVGDVTITFKDGRVYRVVPAPSIKPEVEE